MKIDLGESNDAAKLKCPKCGSAAEFYIYASIAVSVSEGKMSFDSDNLRWGDDSFCDCEACGHHGSARSFSNT